MQGIMRPDLADRWYVRGPDLVDEAANEADAAMEMKRERERERERGRSCAESDKSARCGRP